MDAIDALLKTKTYIASENPLFVDGPSQTAERHGQICLQEVM